MQQLSPLIDCSTTTSTTAAAAAAAAAATTTTTTTVVTAVTARLSLVSETPSYFTYYRPYVT